MGEVYRARDTRLDRSVAIKVLPAEFAGDAAFKLRFEREAKTISSLSHPHICALYDVGESGTVSYLVMEYVDGESLADRLTKGPLPIDGVLKLGVEIASALDAAHRQGIVHRDVKPGNIMLTRSGAKLLDFGLAKESGVVRSIGTATAATEMKPLTDQGTVIGTFQYMAPEQLEGQPADARSDIFALGAVLYEAATGVRAFQAKSRASLIAAILDQEPAPISTLRPLAPMSLERVVRACLRKDPADRIQTAHDLMLDLTWIRESSSAGEAVAVGARARKRDWRTLGLISLLALTTAAFAALYFRRSTPPPAAATTFSVLPAANGSTGELLAVSRDGSALAYSGSTAGSGPVLWVRRFADPVPRSLPGTENAQWPFWSPDGRSLGFFAEGRLKKINVATGSVQDLCGGGYGVGGVWTRDGTIYFARRFKDGLYRVPATGGDPVAVTRLNGSRGESAHAWPSVLSDERHLVFLVRTKPEERNRIAVAPVSGGPLKFLVVADAIAGFSAPYLLFVKENVLYAQVLDEEKLALSGEPVEVASNIGYSENWASSGISANDAGVIAYYPAYAPGVDIRVYNRAGNVVQTLLSDTGISGAEMSPDGKRVSFLKFDTKKGAVDIWIADLERGVRTRITSGLANSRDAAWSPDGKRIAFSSDRAGMYDIYTHDIDSDAPARVVWRSEEDKLQPSWTADGTSLIVSKDSATTAGDLHIVPLNGGPPRPLSANEFLDETPAVSPDGRWIAFTSYRSTRPEVFVMTLAGGAPTQVSTQGGRSPAWSKTGTELFYLSLSRSLMSVMVRETGGRPRAAAATSLFALPRTYGDAFSVAGDKFLVPVLDAGGAAPDHINVILGWRGRLPAR
jgi:Tol biopolymer transport system component